MSMTPSERVRVGLCNRAYDIVIGPGLLKRLGGLIKETVGDRPLILVSELKREYQQVAFALTELLSKDRV